MDSLWVMVW